jgi:hypothetical protein
MPKYRFLCSECSNELMKITSIETEVVKCCVCNGDARRQLPNIGGQQVNETVNSYTNTTVNQNQTEILAKRRDDHYWEVEVPRLVEKYSIETCLENQWLVYNDKGELTINKPPSKR